MNLKLSGYSILIRYLILLSIGLTAGCNYLENVLSLENPVAESASAQVHETEREEPIEPKTLIAQKSVLQGLIRIPVTGAAKQTADDLNEADRPAVDRFRLGQELDGLSTGSWISEATNEIEYQINDHMDFSVNDGLVVNNRFLRGRLRYISENAYWWTSLNSHVDDAQIAAAAMNFEEQVRVNSELTTMELVPGIDKASRIHILMVDQPNWLEEIDYFSIYKSVPCKIEPAAGIKDLIFINLSKIPLGTSTFTGGLAHEYSQLIHWRADANEDYWLKEATAKLAQFLSGAPQRTNNLGLTNAEIFSEFPAIQLNYRPENKDLLSDELSAAHSGAELLFSVYLLEQYGPQLIKNIVMNPDPGILGIHEELSKLPGSPRFEDVYASWIVANLINRSSLAGGEFGYKNIRPAKPLLEEIKSFDGEIHTGQLPPFGARYFEVLHEAPVQVTFSGSTMARLTPADPVSGAYAWYSNRGDETEFTLERTFDLSSVETATLKFKAWYQLEEFYDYAYVEVSSDGGRSWGILNTIHGTEKDPHRLSLGVGYTGSTFDWIYESIDLSAFSSQEIRIRFHVITDYLGNGFGFQVDDISIPELGYYDGAENNLGGWETKGFVRSSNFVPGKWILWLINANNPIRVERIDTGSNQNADFWIDAAGGRLSRSFIVISPIAPVTTKTLDYEIKFQQNLSD